MTYPAHAGDSTVNLLAARMAPPVNHVDAEGINRHTPELPLALFVMFAPCPWPTVRFFAGYTILRLLGSGGMGEVYLALHPRLPRRDALKILPTNVNLRPVCEACRTATERPNAGIVHPPGDETQWDWLELPDPPEFWGWGKTAHLLVGSRTHSGKWRAVLSASEDQPTSSPPSMR
jgi:serine/threonine protein kinase